MVFTASRGWKYLLRHLFASTFVYKTVSSKIIMVTWFQSWNFVQCRFSSLYLFPSLFNLYLFFHSYLYFHLYIFLHHSKNSPDLNVNLAAIPLCELQVSRVFPNLFLSSNFFHLLVLNLIQLLEVKIISEWAPSQPSSI